MFPSGESEVVSRFGGSEGIDNRKYLYIRGLACSQIGSLISTQKPGEEGTWVNFCWVCAAGISEPLPQYSLFCGPL